MLFSFLWLVVACAGEEVNEKTLFAHRLAALGGDTLVGFCTLALVLSALLAQPLRISFAYLIACVLKLLEGISRTLSHLTVDYALQRSEYVGGLSLGPSL